MSISKLGNERSLPLQGSFTKSCSGLFNDEVLSDLIRKLGAQGKTCPRIHSTSVICPELPLCNSQGRGNDCPFLLLYVSAFTETAWHTQMHRFLQWAYFGSLTFHVNGCSLTELFYQTLENQACLKYIIGRIGT